MPATATATSRIILEIADLRLTGEGPLPVLAIVGLALLYVFLKNRRQS